MRRFLLLLACMATASWAVAADTNRSTVILVVGAPGEPEFGSNFVQQVQYWNNLCDRAVAKVIRIGADATNTLDDRELLKRTLAAEPVDGSDPLWLVLIGHGTFDGKEARFNLRGPDVSNVELAEWLKPSKRPLAVINCASASAPFLKSLSGTNRVVITATRSGSELNYTRFGEYLAKAIVSPDSDLDKDGQVSLLEAFLVGSRNVSEFYKTEGRLETEHALIEDNGDGLGTPADWFRGVRATKKSRGGAPPDGTRANQFSLLFSPEEKALPPEVRAQRNALELQIDRLRESKSTLPEDEYYQKLEALFLELARLQEQAKPVTN